jgi:hypothetical protein
VPDIPKREQIERKLAEYLRMFATEVDLSRAEKQWPVEWHIQIRHQIIDLMAEADRLAKQFRSQVADASDKS